MWPYALCSAAIAALLSLCSHFLQLTEATTEIIDRVCMYVIPAVSVGFIASRTLQHVRRVETSDGEHAEFVGNVPLTWTHPSTAEVITVLPRPKLPPQSIFSTRARLAVSVTN